MAEPDGRAPLSARRAIALAATRLAATSDTPRLDAELLMAEALGLAREALLMRGLDLAAPAGFAAFVERRAAHEPIAYILGRRAFWTIELQVTPAVLIPRPDSEALIEAALAECRRPPDTILDLGTGSGALLLAALGEWPHARGVGVDRSEAAVAVARANAAMLGLADRADIRWGDWGTALRERFDLILCNPPYVEQSAALAADVVDYEPAEALFAGPDGLDDYRRLMPQLQDLLETQGIAILEIGASQADSVGRLAQAAGFYPEVRRDLAGRDRAILLRRIEV